MRISSREIVIQCVCVDSGSDGEVYNGCVIDAIEKFIYELSIEKM